MKLRDLRRFILEADGEIKIGSVKIKHDDGCDIDVSLNGSLVCWISAGVSGDVNLVDVPTTIADNVDLKVNQNLKDEISGKNEVIEKLELDLRETKSQLSENQLAVGKVEAYEKLLLGRSVSIGS